MIRPGFGFLHDGDIANPFVSSEWRERVPQFRDRRIRSEKRSQVSGYSMKRSGFFCGFGHRFRLSG